MNAVNDNFTKLNIMVSRNL